MADWRALGADYVPYIVPRPAKCPLCGLDTMTRLETHVSDGYSVSWHCIPCRENAKRIAAEEKEAFKRSNGIYDEHVVSLTRLYTGRAYPSTRIWDMLFRTYKSEKLRAKRLAAWKIEYDLMVTAYCARFGTQPIASKKEALFSGAVERVSRLWKSKYPLRVA